VSIHSILDQSRLRNGFGGGLGRLGDPRLGRAVLRTHVGHQTEPRVHQVGIFLQGPPVVVGARKTRAELWSSCKEAVGPVYSVGEGEEKA
jgi:hypothetical protein